MKKWICIALAGLLMLVSAAFPAFALEFTDANGRRVESEHPQRVVSLYNSYGEAWLAAGGTLVGSIADEFGDREMHCSIQNLGSHRTPNMELLFSLEPDFVLLSADVASHREIAVLLEQANIPCAFFSTPDYESYMSMMQLFCSLTGRDDLYRKQIDTVQRPIEALIREAEEFSSHPTALLIRANSTSVKCRNSEATVAGYILQDMGFENLADGNGALCESIGMESILIEDPDYIFAVLQGTSSEAAENSLSAVLTGNPAWNTLTAVREGRFFILDRELFHYHPNERWAEAYRFIFDILKGET